MKVISFHYMVHIHGYFSISNATSNLCLLDGLNNKRQTSEIVSHEIYSLQNSIRVLHRQTMAENDVPTTFI